MFTKSVSFSSWQNKTIWETITRDATILSIIQGVKIEFVDNCPPKQFHTRSSIFNHVEHAIIVQEIEKLLSEDVIVPSVKKKD